MSSNGPFRIRRIKCDEAKPSCDRCSSTGRKCDGYQAERVNDELFQPGTHHHTLRRAISPASFSTATDFELRAIQHFQRQTMPALSASFDNDFWNTVVLQISGTELPVRSAVIAFSSLHQCYEYYGKSDTYSAVDQSNEIRLHGLTHYNIAVRQTAQLLDIEDPTSCSTALISCLLFICLELIQDNYAAAITHLTGGLRLLYFCENAQRARPLLPSLSTLNNRLKHIFGRIVVQTMFLGDTHYDISIIPKPFEIETLAILSSVAEARDLLDSLFLSAYGFLHLLSTKPPSHASGAIELYQTRLLNELQNWYRLFREFVEVTEGHFTTKESLGVILLEIHYVSLLIMLETALDKSKTFWSTSTSPFLRITNLVESLLCQQDPFRPSVIESPAPKLPRYSFDLGIIGPLFYTSVKCWNSLIREKAISLLRHPSTPRREGMWSADAAATIAQQIIDMEEDLVSSAANLTLDTDVVKSSEEVRPEAIEEKIWFDIERPIKDEKRLKIFVGAKPDKKREERERKEEVITW